ncbi:MAG: hypothetical protein JNK92_14125, partial [Dechloromonas sp.]|nr:hypothetical protein [Dechloromonas sp.]
AARIERKARLNYGVAETGEPVDHRQVIEKAMAEGKPVPATVLATYPELAAQQAKKGNIPAKTAQQTRQQSPIERRDDIVGAILRVTGGKGVAANMAQTIVGDKANAATKVRGLFTNRGTMDLDDTAGLLREEEGFDVRDGNHLAELIREQASGNPVHSMERVERDAAESAEKQYRDDIRQRAAALGIKTVAVKFDAIERAVLETETKQAQDEADEERAAIQAANDVSDNTINELLQLAGADGRYINEEWITNDQILDAFEPVGESEEESSADGTSEAVAGEAGGNRQERGQEARPDFGLAAQSNELAATELAARKAAIAEEKRQHDALIAQNKRESNAKEKARRAAQVLAEREAAKKAEVDKDIEAFALGQTAPPPVNRKVSTEDARGQQEAQLAQEAEAKAVEPWQMTYDEYLNTFDAEGREWEGSRSMEHRASVQKAVNEGKMSADAASMEYPDIASESRRKRVPATLDRIVSAARGVTEAEIDNSANNVIKRLSPELKKLFGNKKMSLKEVGVVMNWFDDILRPFDLGMQIGQNFNPNGQVEYFNTIRDKVAAVIESVYRKVLYAPASGSTVKQDTNKVQISQPATVDAKKEAEARIEDAGEMLDFIRKNRQASMEREYSDAELANLPLSKIWPAEEIDGIEDTFIAAVSTTARAEIPAKPRTSYKVNAWVRNVKSLRGLVQNVMNSTEPRDKVRDRLMNWKTLGDFYSKVVLLESIDRAQWKRIGYVQERPNAYQYKDGEKIPTPMVAVNIDGKHHYIDNAGTVAEALDRINELLGVEAKPKPMQFEIRGRGGFYFINKKGDKEYRKLKTFTSVDDARKFLRESYDELIAEWEGVKDRDNVKKTDVRNASSRPRTGKDWRNGKDVGSERFSETFGFRAVAFGKLVEQGAGAKERQGMLNQAYDALMDLSEILGIPPKAISLNGTMAIGFGADGKGWASAHFSPSNLFINLTKTRGAGTIAHEWFHALDNYFARMRNDGNEVQFTGDQNDYRKNNYVTYKPEAMYVHKTKRSAPMSRADLQRMHEQNPRSEYWMPENWEKDKSHPEGIRPQVETAFSQLVETLNASPMLNRARKNDSGPEGYWSRIIERGARSFENYIIHKMMEGGYQNDYLANVKSAEDFIRDKGRYPYLLPEEVAPVAEAFDNLFNTIETKETDKGVALYSKASNKSWYYSQLAKAIEQSPDRVFTTGTQVKLWLAG